MARTKRDPDSDTIKPVKLYEEKKCQHCSKWFVQTDPRQMYCDPYCRLQFNNNLLNERMKELRRQKKAGNILPEANLETVEGRKQLTRDFSNQYQIKYLEASDYVVFGFQDGKSIDDIRRELESDIKTGKLKTID